MWMYRIKVLDVRTGSVQELRSSDGEQDRGVFRGVPVPDTWLKDGETLLLFGMTFGENCCSWGHIALDGSGFAALNLPGGVPSPNGSLFASVGHTGSGVGCYTPRHDLLLYNLVTLQSTTPFRDPERGVEVVAWSPDGSTVLFRAVPLTPPVRQDCPSDARDPDWPNAEYLLLHVASGRVEPVAADDARIAAWRTPGRAEGVAVRCDDPNEALSLCQPARLEFNGQTVARGGPLAVLGWLP
jgi:hypothetical protein